MATDCVADGRLTEPLGLTFAPSPSPSCSASSLPPSSADCPPHQVLGGLPAELLRGRLIVDVLSVKQYAKKVLLDGLPAEADILCTHPMFGPESGKNSWHGLPLVFEQVRVVII